MAKKKKTPSKPMKKPAAARAAATPKRGAKPARAAAKKPASARKPKAMDPEAMMAAWMKAMTPAEGHHRLAPLVGTFVARTTFWMAPGAPGDSHDGVSEHDWVLGGRFVQQRYRGTAMGMPFEGIGYTGFDNVRGKYASTWMDTMGTGIMNSVGTGKPTESQIGSVCTAWEAGAGMVEIQGMIRIQDHDHHTFELRRKGPNGKTFRNMLVEYKRK